MSMSDAKTASPLSALEAHDEFLDRHIGPGGTDISAMLNVVGAASLEALAEETIPPSILDERPLDLQPSISELETLQRLRAIADRNQLRHNMIGLGYHDTVTPTVILRNILENPGWYTAYTPYQAEISQGRLEAMLNYQHMVCDLTGMELANASLLDEAHRGGRGHGATQAHQPPESKSNRFVVDQRLSAADAGCAGKSVPSISASSWPWVTRPKRSHSGDCFGVLLQYPGASGARSTTRVPVIEQAHARGWRPGRGGG